MATRVTPSQARLFAQLLAEWEPQMRAAFMASVTDIQAGVDWPALLGALAVFNTEAAIAALNISPAAWAEYSSTMTAAYAKAGASTAAQIQQAGIGGVGTRFNMTNPRAQAWIAENVGVSVAGFTREQVEVARKVIEEGYALGQGPRTIALDLGGRVTNGYRQGGVLGLDGPRAARLQTVTQGMRTAEGVKSLVIQREDGSLVPRYKVNPATAQRIIKAYREGTEVPEESRVVSERQYRNALLQARADTVAETETANAVMGARDEQWRQTLDAQGLSENDVIKTWKHNRGTEKEFRPDHVAMNGQSVRGIDTPFIFADGARLKYAHDPAGGAKHTIRCGCDTIFRLDHSAGLS